MKIIEQHLTEIEPTWQEFTLVNDNQTEVSFLNYGGIITEIKTPDQDGNVENIVLGFEDYRDYTANPAFFGAIIGRVAGRIPNASLPINNQTYQLSANEGINHLHGGPNGFHSVLWEAESFRTDHSVGVTLTHRSPDNDGGYPGTLDVDVTYELDNQNRFTITYHAKTDKTTPLALTNHSYFNLSGNGKHTVENHSITMPSKRFAELDSNFIPTGNILDAAGTPFDFTNGRHIKGSIESDHPQNKIVGSGYDHYFLFVNRVKPDVKVCEPESGRTLTVTTDEPGMVMYTSNNLDENLKLKSGTSRNYMGLCLETQRHPATLSHSNFPPILLTPEKEYRSRTTFTFDTED
ncbi:aldose epimerase family protein [Virgibacillus ihumii]|uniref:aldose epimerase family protein n=1 Tax=Virgibacillus ihumii TaxID=2686091 RepID=UPI00157D565A|nr:aldose epimerase family protein [Virgibacillus ihumii]